MNTFVLEHEPAVLPEFVFEERYEIIDGNFVELPVMAAQSSVIASRLARILSNFAEPIGLGEAYTEVLIKLPLLSDRNRRPDVAYVPYSQWPRDRAIPKGNAWNVLPDLVVEVVSPNDFVDSLRDKIQEYLASGVRLVWVVYPSHQQVDVYDTSDHFRTLKLGDTLDGSVVLPGFQLALTVLFRSQIA